jgi:hypothetical protein
MSVPASLDHLILGASDLTRGIAFVEQHTGVRAALGGVHPGRGTHNALLSLGPQRYLEILAPDPNQQTLTWFRNLPQLSEPRLIGWMARSDDVSSLGERLHQSGVSCDDPRESSRRRPDGRTLGWKLARLADNPHSLLPFLIEWSRGSPHPAEDAPTGCSLLQFEVSCPEPDPVQRILHILGVDLSVSDAKSPQLRGTRGHTRTDF